MNDGQRGGELPPVWVLVLCALLLLAILLVAVLEPRNPARKKCEYRPGAVCTCAGVRGEYVYGCECCEASPCRPQADMDLEKVLKGERAKAKSEHENRKQPGGTTTDEH